MGVDIHEPRRDHQPLGVDFVAARVRDFTDKRDAIAVDRDVAQAGGGPGSVHQAAVANHQIVHGSPIACRYRC